MKISACIIVKNEENNILRCLKSIKDKVDEIIIVDTGSTDSTKHLAKRFTDKIYNFKFEEADGLGNFARARNYAISKAKGDYIFWIDADEELFDLSNSFRSLIQDNPESVLFRQAQCLPKEDHEYSGDQLHDRLFKNDGIKFVGVVHEYPSRDGKEYLPSSKFQNDCIILHYGYSNLRVKGDKSIARNGPLIEKNLALNPDNPVAQYYKLTYIWSKFVFDLDNIALVQEAFDWWDEKLSKHNNKWIRKISINILQNFFNHISNKVEYEGVFGRTEEEAKLFQSLLDDKYSNNDKGNQNGVSKDA